MQFLSEFAEEMLDVNGGNCLNLSEEAIVCGGIFGEVIGEWNGSAQSQNCVSFLCKGEGPRTWLVNKEPTKNTKRVVISPKRENKLYLMFVVPLVERTVWEVKDLAEIAKDLMQKKSSLKIFGRGFVRYGRGHVFCVFAEFPESRPLQWFESPETLGVWMEKLYDDCALKNICFDRELMMEDFVVCGNGAILARLDKYATGGTFGTEDRMKFLCVLMELLTGRKFLLYQNTTKENLKKRVQKTLERERKEDKGNVLPLVWRILSEI